MQGKQGVGWGGEQRRQGRLSTLMLFVVHRPCRFEMLGWFGLVWAGFGRGCRGGKGRMGDYTHSCRSSFIAHVVLKCWAGLGWFLHGRQVQQRRQGRLSTLMPFVVHRPCRFEMLGWFWLVWAGFDRGGRGGKGSRGGYTHSCRSAFIAHVVLKFCAGLSWFELVWTGLDWADAQKKALRPRGHKRFAA